MWYHIKDPDQFKLKPPRRWDPSGLKKHAPRPFYNREDGHFLLNNTCTIANLCLLPELRRLQCYFFSKLPKIRKERNFWLPMKKVRTHSFRCIHMRCWDFELELPRGLEAFQRCPSWWCFIKLQNSDTVSEKLCNSCNFLNVSRWSFWPIWRGQWIQYNDFSWSSEWNIRMKCHKANLFYSHPMLALHASAGQWWCSYCHALVGRWLAKDSDPVSPHIRMINFWPIKDYTNKI
jgi:hypothetical protein